MEFVDPIKEIDQINAMKIILQKQSYRDLLLFSLGINTGISISDLLIIKSRGCMDRYRNERIFNIHDEKSGKTQEFYLNNQVKRVLKNYFAYSNLSSIRLSIQIKKE